VKREGGAALAKMHIAYPYAQYGKFS